MTKFIKKGPAVALAAAVMTALTGGIAFATIDMTLDFDARNSEVTELQTFLATDVSVYPEGLVTGYFGTLTQKAVQRLQCKYNIICSGTPATTGYGRVGPKTMALINSLLVGTGVDVHAPVISNVAVSTQPTSTTVSWNTNENARSKIRYSTTFPFLYASAAAAADATVDMTSSVMLTGLQPNTVYYYNLESVDAKGNIMWTVPSNTFKTQP